MTYRAIVIDPRMGRVLEAQLPEGESDNLAALQALVGGWIEAACQFDTGDVLMVNEEGRLHGEDAAFKLVGCTDWLMGQGVIVGSNEDGETCSARSPLDEIKRRAVFGRRP